MGGPDPATAAAGDGDRRAAAAGIHRLALPTPFLVGRINAYLIDDEPLTLVDTGVNSGTSLDALEQALAVHGRRIEDIERVVLTHQHMDHTGLLAIIARRSGAEVAAFAPLVPWLADFSAATAADDDWSAALMRRHGLPSDVLSVIQVVGRAFRSYGSRGDVTLPLQDGDELGFAGRRLQVSHVPGHSPSDIVLLDPERRLLIGGDHLLGRISSNPLISRPLGAGTDAPRPRTLIDYMASMIRTQELDVDLVLPGHGEPFTGHAALIDERLGLHERRARKIRGLLEAGETEPQSAHAIAVSLWGDLAITQALLTISEVLGHLDLLVDRRQAIVDESAEVVHYSAVG